MRLENKVALITGGYGGMGRASARLFAQEGVQLCSLPDVTRSAATR
jgi:NAD(P)-dependent dehydrogenase (short-subunit alcohol dehydrogenase family)